MHIDRCVTVRKMGNFRGFVVSSLLFICCPVLSGYRIGLYFKAIVTPVLKVILGEQSVNKLMRVIG